MIILYDDYCPSCTQFANIVKKLDWYNCIQINKLHNSELTSRYKNLNIGLAEKELASYTTKWHYGFDSLYLISSRLPILWLFLPIIYLLKITNVGNWLYRLFAKNRLLNPMYCQKNKCPTTQSNYTQTVNKHKK